MTDDRTVEAPGRTEELTTEHLVGGPDRRFYAFVLDRLLAWRLYAAAAWAAYTFLIEPGRAVAPASPSSPARCWWSGCSPALAIGLWGITPGKALVGLRVLSADDARPISFGRALLRTAHPGRGHPAHPRLRCGRAGLDGDDGPVRLAARLARPARPGRWWSMSGRSPYVEEPEVEAPRQVVNLTAMRLVPASPTPPRRIPSRGPRPSAPPPAPPAAPTVTPRQGLGWPLVGEAPGQSGTASGRPARRGRPPTPARHARAGRSPSTPATSSR